MHTPDAEGRKIVHPVNVSCVRPYIMYRNNVHSPGAQVPKCVHPAAKWCMPGAGCEHCTVCILESIASSMIIGMHTRLGD